MVLERKSDESALDPHLLRSAGALPSIRSCRRALKMRLISGYTFDLEADLLHCFIIAAVMVTDSEPVPLTMGGQQGSSKQTPRSTCEQVVLDEP